MVSTNEAKQIISRPTNVVNERDFQQNWQELKSDSSHFLGPRYRLNQNGRWPQMNQNRYRVPYWKQTNQNRYRVPYWKQTKLDLPRKYYGTNSHQIQWQPHHQTNEQNLMNSYSYPTRNY